MSILGGCFRTGLGRFGYLAPQRHLEDIGEDRDAFMRDGFVHDRVASLAQRGESRLNFPTFSGYTEQRRGGRVVEGARLESV